MNPPHPHPTPHPAPPRPAIPRYLLPPCPQSLAKRYCANPTTAGDEMAAVFLGDQSSPTPDQAAQALSYAGASQCPSTAKEIWNNLYFGGYLGMGIGSTCNLVASWLSQTHLYVGGCGGLCGRAGRWAGRGGPEVAPGVWWGWAPAL